MPPRRRVLDAVDMDYWLIWGGGRDSEHRRQAQYDGALRQLEAVVPGAARRRHPAIWAESFAVLRVPKLFNLRTDPYERTDTTSNTYWDWVMDHTFLAVPTQAIVGEFLATFQEFPPRQKAASFTIDQGMDKLLAGIARRQP
jgi:hypothetical protein